MFVLLVNCSSQRLDSLPVTKKKSIPKSLTQVWIPPFSFLLLSTFLLDEEEEHAEAEQEDGQDVQEDAGEAEAAEEEGEV